MALSWKDAVTTFLALIVFGFSYSIAQGIHIPFVPNFRIATLVLLILGIGMCAMSSANGQSSPYVTALGVLGFLSLTLIIAGIITGAKVVFLATAGTILLLWLLATVRHAVGA
jgi:hypothetical protein